ncbi:nuclease domain-containing protein [Vibrio harveyi]|uniref:nuclease domain-containing protein n=1 Tax=Vibrio harveyi TaxID=669 RepID=UPI0006836C25|nr:nuclease domain-containing protein [Vibrio harveyi]
MKVESKKIRKAAKGQDCTLRLIGICNFNPETTVLAHIGFAGGWATKCGDNIAVFACSNCHEAIDSHGRSKHAADKLRALEETQQLLIDKGLLTFL